MAYRGARILFSVLGLAACGTLAVRGDDWPGWRGPARNGKSAETGLLKAWPEGGPSLMWKASGIGKGFSSVAVVKGTVYATGDVGGDLTLSALNDKARAPGTRPAEPSRPRQRPWRSSATLPITARSTPTGSGGFATRSCCSTPCRTTAVHSDLGSGVGDELVVEVQQAGHADVLRMARAAGDEGARETARGSAPPRFDASSGNRFRASGVWRDGDLGAPSLITKWA